ncbi:hypothetical protein FCM35_KLT16519 [Carex littledalei]|uniref:adenine phosphoribosyltransferase n=1 Tax=Carex littledalei TaxID=544730 RepID=A0A833RFX6_9POAL|nr:hypothetical protein FCM35_KLT16519 [Carex littledalei]
MVEKKEINNGVELDPRLKAITSSIRVVPNFPKPGIMFNDITTLLLKPKVFKDAIDMFVERYKGMHIDAVAGIEARGFIFGPPIALALNAKFVPLRKPKKLPGEVISEKYVLEYGKDCLEMHVGALQAHERVLIIDDLVATGGTLSAAISLIERAGAEVVECACLLGIPKFNDSCKVNGKPVHFLVDCLMHELLGNPSQTKQTALVKTRAIMHSGFDASVSGAHQRQFLIAWVLKGYTINAPTVLDVFDGNGNSC